jgi:hypothetical protein
MPLAELITLQCRLLFATRARTVKLANKIRTEFIDILQLLLQAAQVGAGCWMLGLDADLVMVSKLHAHGRLYRRAEESCMRCL